MQLKYDFEASGRIDFSYFTFAERMQQGDVTTRSIVTSYSDYDLLVSASWTRVSCMTSTHTAEGGGIRLMCLEEKVITNGGRHG
jgi:hypothetical protein